MSPTWKPLQLNQKESYMSKISQTPLLQVLTHNNSLHFRPFSPSEFQHNVHDTYYRCRAMSESGIALSRRVRVSAGN